MPATKRKTTTKRATAKRASTKKPAARKTTAKKTTARKTTAKKTTARKTTARKVTAKAAPRKVGNVSAPMKKTEMFSLISDNTGVPKKQISEVFDQLADLMEGHLKKRACGEFTLPGLAKFKVVRKPATKARKGINPFTGEETVFKAKPARNVVKVRPLKKVKEMAE